MQTATTHILTGTVMRKAFFSEALQVEKKYNIYLPPSYFTSEQSYPVVYLFRGHENEWFDPYQDHSRGGTAIQHLMNELIRSGAIGEMIIVGPGMTSTDGKVYGLGVNFLNPKLAAQSDGVGTGQFQDYFTQDLIGHIDATYRTISDRTGRAADGFSLGGFTAIMLAIKHPELFSSVGSYDGTFMFLNMSDPRWRVGPHSDTLWVRQDDMFAHAFRRKGQHHYDVDYMLTYNPINVLKRMRPARRKLVDAIRFFITTAAYDDNLGNRDRGVHMVTLLQMLGIENMARSLVLSNDAHHTWKFADLHMRKNLRRHSESFSLKPHALTQQDKKPFLPNVEFIEIRDLNPREGAVEIVYRIYNEIAVKLDVYSPSGEHVLTLEHEKIHCGRHSVKWEGKNAHGHWVSSGVYFAQLSTHEGALQHKFVLFR